MHGQRQRSWPLRPFANEVIFAPSQLHRRENKVEFQCISVLLNNLDRNVIHALIRTGHARPIAAISTGEQLGTNF